MMKTEVCDANWTAGAPTGGVFAADAVAIDKDSSKSSLSSSSCTFRSTVRYCQ